MICLFLLRRDIPSGLGPLHCRGFEITFMHATLVWTPLDEWSARHRDLYLTTQTPTDIHAPGESLTYYSSKRVATDPGLRPRGHWHRYNTRVGSQCQCYIAKFLVKVVDKLVIYPFDSNHSCITSNKSMIIKNYTKYYFYMSDSTRILQSLGNALCWVTHWQRHLWQRNHLSESNN